MHESADGIDRLLAEYRTDLESFFATATASGAKVVFFTGPSFADPGPGKRQTEGSARSPRNLPTTTTGSASAARSAPRWAVTVRVAPAVSHLRDCRDGLHRGTDSPNRTVANTYDKGLHLCPGGLGTGRLGLCATYSSGEFRFGAAAVNTLIDPPPPELP